MSPEAVSQSKPIVDYNKIPQRFQKYPASERAKKIVHEAITMDALFGTAWPTQWSTPEGPEFHDVMAQMHSAGFKVLAINPSADSAGDDFTSAIRALNFFLKKITEHPERYKIVRTTRDIDEAIAEGKLGMYFTHQGVNQYGQDFDRVAVFRQLGYGYCLLAYNSRNWVGDGCFEPENAGLTGMGKLLVDAYNHFGMVLDVSHCGEKLSLDVCARSRPLPTRSWPRWSTSCSSMVTRRVTARNFSAGISTVSSSRFGGDRPRHHRRGGRQGCAVKPGQQIRFLWKRTTFPQISSLRGGHK